MKTVALIAFSNYYAATLYRVFINNYNYSDKMGMTALHAACGFSSPCTQYLVHELLEVFDSSFLSLLFVSSFLSLHSFLFLFFHFFILFFFFFFFFFFLFLSIFLSLYILHSLFCISFSLTQFHLIILAEVRFQFRDCR